PPVPEGEGLVSGQVLTDQRQPLVGVVVTAKSYYPEKRSWAGLNTEQRIRDQIRFEKWRASARHEAVTDASGRYTLQGLSRTAEYAVRADLEGWSISNVQNADHIKPDASIDFIAEPRITVTITVRMPDGSAASDARVSCGSADEGYRTSASTDRAGKAELHLRPGRWKLRARSGNEAIHQSEEAALTIERGMSGRSLELQLLGRPGVRGSVSIPEGYQREYYSIMLFPAGGPDPGTRLEYEDRKGKLADFTLWVEREPEYLILDLEPRQYRVVLLGDSQVLDWRDIHVADDIVRCDMKVAEPVATDYIPVCVFDPEGQATRDVQIQLGVAQRYMGSPHVYYPPGEAGLIWIYRVEMQAVLGNSLNPQEFIITVTSRENGRLTKTYPATSRSVIEFRFQKPASVELTVPGYNDHALRKRLTWSLVASGEHGDSTDNFDIDRRDAEDNQEPFAFGPYAPGE
ncbi:MAG: carboxypeptidase regulatory-like domain-containing protein, partial [Planctomycetes bacterium]|nr:carboxypeptidase regulatory-like domain-containing protein [Planctomycetota bacterium]